MKTSLTALITIALGLSLSSYSADEKPDKKALPDLAGLIKTWPVNTWKLHATIKESKTGNYVYKTKDGTKVGQLNYKDGLITDGLKFVIGASDFRYIQQFENGKIVQVVSFYGKDGKWGVFPAP